MATPFIYTENPQEAIELVHPGFAEWILNQHRKPYRRMINKLITLFKEQHYKNKEKLTEALTNLLRDSDPGKRKAAVTGLDIQNALTKVKGKRYKSHSSYPLRDLYELC